jgi:hypothetical protein
MNRQGIRCNGDHTFGTNRVIAAHVGGKMPEKRILLVEDEATNREILTYALREEGRLSLA